MTVRQLQFPFFLLYSIWLASLWSHGLTHIYTSPRISPLQDTLNWMQSMISTWLKPKARWFGPSSKQSQPVEKSSKMVKLKNIFGFPSLNIWFSLPLYQRINDLSFDWLDLFCILKFYDVFLRYLLSEKETCVCMFAWRLIQ